MNHYALHTQSFIISYVGHNFSSVAYTCLLSKILYILRMRDTISNAADYKFKAEMSKSYVSDDNQLRMRYYIPYVAANHVTTSLIGWVQA